jgi:23S rRNA (guanosine2251-2'-O)-methyltransferase
VPLRARALALATRLPRLRVADLVVYGRQPVREALAHPSVVVEQVLVCRDAVGVEDIVDAARARGVAVRLVSADKVGRVSGNRRQDQGVVATVAVPAAVSSAALNGPVVVLDGVTNPANVGMIIRTAAAFGFGVMVPDAGSPEIGPLVVKASAGVALFAPVRRCATAAAGVADLRAAGYQVIGLRAGAAPLGPVGVAAAERFALVLGSETAGLSPEVAALVDDWAGIPMAGGVESLNVAVAAGIACYALTRTPETLR